MHQTKKVG